MLFTIFLMIVVFIGITYGYGVLYAIVCDANRKAMIKAFNWFGFSILSVIGVPFHELSHLITALIFRHRITGIALYRPIEGKKDGCLGYVKHSYNKNSLFQSFGNFFIGSAPMVFGAGLLSVLLYIAFPSDFISVNSVPTSLNEALLILKNISLRLLHIFTTVDNFNITLLFIIIIAILICPHLGMSGADFKGVISGSVFLLAASVIIPVYLHSRFNIDYAFMYVIVVTYVIYYTYSLFIGLIVSLIVLIINKILCVFARQF